MVSLVLTSTGRYEGKFMFEVIYLPRDAINNVITISNCFQDRASVFSCSFRAMCAFDPSSLCLLLLLLLPAQHQESGASLLAACSQLPGGASQWGSRAICFWMAPGLSPPLDRWAFASAQVGLGSNTLLTACLTELVIDLPREKNASPQSPETNETLRTQTCCWKLLWML